MANDKTRCVLTIGHSEKAQGARNPATGITEYQYNEMLAECIENSFFLSREQDLELIIWRRKGCYSSLPGEINKLNPDFIVSMHCNAFDRQTNGLEVLYSGSNKGKALATAMYGNMNAIPTHGRGVKIRSLKERGGLLLHKTKAPCIICEPFFIDSRRDFMFASRYFLKLAMNYCHGIVDAAKLLKSIEAGKSW